MTEPTDAELDALIATYHKRMYPQDNQPRYERAIMRAAVAQWGQPAQAAEPVLFALQWPEDRAAGRICVSVIFDNEAEAKDYAASCTDVTILPLFTAPQPVAREPLTHAQAKALVLKYDNDPLNLVFQVELAHGIKGGQHG